MLMMRLQRVGRKNDPSYRVVVTDKRTGPKSNKHVDLLGSFNPKSGAVQIDGEKAKYWLSQGVKPSITLHNMLVSNKVIEGKKLNALSKKSPIVDEEALKKAAEEKAAAEAAAAAASEAPAAEAVAAEETPAETAEEPKEEATA
jgi:small subunit ribosomal protein S16